MAPSKGILQMKKSLTNPQLSALVWKLDRKLKQKIKYKQGKIAGKERPSLKWMNLKNQ